mmetsp:Transcript_16192/g.54521  ORF Transcript_16192/g.54521 Transcript_16192/m.54521 type:complete len:315 (+) Transcript_16192:19-963(+)
MILSPAQARSSAPRALLAAVVAHARRQRVRLALLGAAAAAVGVLLVVGQAAAARSPTLLFSSAAASTAVPLANATPTTDLVELPQGCSANAVLDALATAVASSYLRREARRMPYPPDPAKQRTLIAPDESGTHSQTGTSVVLFNQSTLSTSFRDIEIATCWDAHKRVGIDVPNVLGYLKKGAGLVGDGLHAWSGKPARGSERGGLEPVASTVSLVEVDVGRTPRLPDYFVARAYGVRSTVAMRYLLEQDTPWSFFGAPEAPLELATGGLVMSMEGMLLLDRVALSVGDTAVVESCYGLFGVREVIGELPFVGEM